MLNAIKSAKTDDERNLAELKYENLIRSIIEDNKETEKEDLRVIPDLDFPNDNRAFMFVTEKSYQQFIESGDESDLVIKYQYRS